MMTAIMLNVPESHYMSSGYCVKHAQAEAAELLAEAIRTDSPTVAFFKPDGKTVTFQTRFVIGVEAF